MFRDDAADGVIFIRVSSDDQRPEIYEPELRRWAVGRGIKVRKVITVQDSASLEGLAGGKGDLFDQAHAEVLEGARLAKWNVVVIWSLDRLSRRGYRDVQGVLDELHSYGCELMSHEEPLAEHHGRGRGNHHPPAGLARPAADEAELSQNQAGVGARGGAGQQERHGRA